MYCATLPLSTPSWAVIDTGQPSIVKSNSYFNRLTGEVTSYLDQLRESLSVVKEPRRTSALWQLTCSRSPSFGLLSRRAGGLHPALLPQTPHRSAFAHLESNFITWGEQSKNPLRLIKRRRRLAYGATILRERPGPRVTRSTEGSETDLRERTVRFLSVLFSRRSTTSSTSIRTTRIFFHGSCGWMTG
jgi:hypothetical protein